MHTICINLYTSMKAMTILDVILTVCYSLWMYDYDSKFLQSGQAHSAESLPLDAEEISL